MTSTATEMVPTAEPAKTDGDAEKEPTRVRRPRRGSEDESDAKARYFLSKTNRTDGTPVLDREVVNEGEALVEALRLGVTFYEVREFRVLPDFTGRKPKLNKEAVSCK